MPEPKNKRKSAGKQSVRQKEAAGAKPERKRRPYTLLDCMKLGKYANILFVVFIVICVIYYHSLAKFGINVIFEIVAYVVETSAFVLFTISVIWMDRLVRARSVMKVLMLLYIAAEVVLMLLEFQFLPWTHYYGLSITLIICHVLFSACCSFSLLLLDPQNPRMQRIVAITTVIVLAGMLPGIAGYRVYASILVNAFAYILFFSATERYLTLEELEIDCYGDQAKVTSFDSTMFADTPTMPEPVMRGKPKTLKERAKRAAEKLKPADEQIVLTDTHEKFEYEFGVQDDDDPDDTGGDDA